MVKGHQKTTMLYVPQSSTITGDVITSCLLSDEDITKL